MRTTLGIGLLEQLKLGTVQKADILRDLEFGAGKSEELRVGGPVITVHFHELREREGSGLAVGTMASSQAAYAKYASVSLYALSDPTRLDVLRFGRHPDQDVQLIDQTVSREHGLVILAGGAPLFCDYGTLKGGAHSGSMNGTYISGVGRVRDTILQWLPAWKLEIGTFQTRGGTPRSRYEIAYELHMRPAPQ